MRYVRPRRVDLVGRVGVLDHDGDESEHGGAVSGTVTSTSGSAQGRTPISCSAAQSG